MAVRDIQGTLDFGPEREDPKVAGQQLRGRGNRLQHFIGGEWCEPDSREWLVLPGPVPEQPYPEIAHGNAADVGRAVTAAGDVLEHWVAIGGHARARYLYGLARHIEKNQRLFALLEKRDNGDPAEAAGDIEIPLLAGHFHRHAGWAQLMKQALPGYREIGVVGLLTPADHPLLDLARKVAPALAMGNTVVLNPEETTSSTAALFAGMCREVGLPPGVFNLVLGEHEVAEALANHRGIAKLAFTGTLEDGRALRRITAGSGKKLALELNRGAPIAGSGDSGLDSVALREGIYGYVRPVWELQLSVEPVHRLPHFVPAEDVEEEAVPGIDRTPRLYIGGERIEPHSGYSIAAMDATGRVIAEIPAGNRKDVLGAVKAARAARGWPDTPAHDRAQVLYRIADKFADRSDTFMRRIAQLSGKSEFEARAELYLCINRIFTNAALADTHGSHFFGAPLSSLAQGLREPLGVIGIACPEEAGLLGLLSTVMPAVAMGNRVVVLPSEHYALLATDFTEILHASDLPAGVVNIVTGNRDVLATVLARDRDIDAMWYWGSRKGSKMVEEAAAATMKRTWVNYGLHHDWASAEQGEGETFLRKATAVK